jgi:hypothetical protein
MSRQAGSNLTVISGFSTGLWCCKACVCVSCDGGVGFTAALKAEKHGDGEAWRTLSREGSTHFRMAPCQ